VLLPCAFNLPTCEEPRRRLWEDKSTVNFLLDFHQVWKEISGDKSTSLFPELTLKELEFLHHQAILLYLSVATGS
jgi:hypothetical protein